MVVERSGTTICGEISHPSKTPPFFISTLSYFSQKIEAPTLISERIMSLENQFEAVIARIKLLEQQKK